MTVCIGAVCADLKGDAAKAVVIAADRMVTIGGFQEFEHEVPKINQITDKVLGLIAGDASRGSKLARELAHAYKDNVRFTVEQVAKMASDFYNEDRYNLVENQFFRPRGFTIEKFYNELQTKLVAGLVGGLDDQAGSYDYLVDFLIAGVDELGGHLFVVSNPGIYRDSLPIGYLVAGSGGLQAMQSMISSGHTPSRVLHETIFNVYASKRRAEAAPGVGRDTDLAIIQAEGVRKLDAKELDGLDTIFEEYQQSSRQQMTDKVEGLGLFNGGKTNETE